MKSSYLWLCNVEDGAIFSRSDSINFIPQPQRVQFFGLFALKHKSLFAFSAFHAYPNCMAFFSYIPPHVVLSMFLNECIYLPISMKTNLAESFYQDWSFDPLKPHMYFHCFFWLPKNLTGDQVGKHGISYLNLDQILIFANLWGLHTVSLPLGWPKRA